MKLYKVIVGRSPYKCEYMVIATDPTTALKSVEQAYVKRGSRPPNLDTLEQVAEEGYSGSPIELIIGEVKD